LRRPLSRPRLHRACLLWLLSAGLFAPAPSHAQAIPDSLRKHRGAAVRNTGPADSVRVSRSAPGTRADTSGGGTADTSAARWDTLGRMSTPSLVGTLDRFADSSGVRTSADLHWLDYRYLGGILETYPGVFVRDQESEGQYSQATFDGVDGRGAAYSANGRRLNDPATGTYNLYHFTPEYADRIEVVTGPRAFLYGLNSTGAAVNLVTKNYNSNKPFTKFNYAEGPYGFSNVDGTFSQNISRKTNVTVGFQHQATDGRFIGEADDAWNAREKIRYNVSRELNIILSHYHTSAQTQMNGGVDVVRSGQSAFDNNASIMKQDSTYEKLTENDVDLSLVGTFLGDTLDVTNLTFYYSHAKREFREREDPYHVFPPAVFSDHVSSWMGAQASQDIAAGIERFSAGGNVELRQVEGSPNLGRLRNVVGALWAKEELDLSAEATLAVYGRIDSYLRKEYAGFGADASIPLGGPLKLFGGASVSTRVPDYQELFWRDSTVIRPGPIVAEHHRIAEAGLAGAGPRWGTVRVSLFHRTVTDPITFSPYAGTASPFPGAVIANGPAINTTGVSAHIDVRILWFSIEGNAEYLLQKSGGATLQTFPKFSGSGGIFYRNKLVNEKLELKTGFRGRFSLSYVGAAFNPEMSAYIQNTGTPLGTTASADFFLIGHIGDAYIHFIWENLANTTFYGTPYYPGGERAIRFGISWEFLN
jgi:outer membrane cobalamin receptor